MHAVIHAADIQDRDGGGLLLHRLFGRFPFLTKLFADAGYQGPVFENAAAIALPGLSVEIVKRSDTAKGFKVCQCAGSSNAALPGSDDAAAWRRISRTSIAPLWSSCNWPPFG